MDKQDYFDLTYSSMTKGVDILSSILSQRKPSYVDPAFLTSKGLQDELRKFGYIYTGFEWKKIA